MVFVPWNNDECRRHQFYGNSNSTKANIQASNADSGAGKVMQITPKQFIRDARLARKLLQDKDGSLKSWSRWLVALNVVFGQPVKPKANKLIRQCTGKDPKKLAKKIFKTVLFLTGRRSGKSIISAVIGAYIALFSGKEKLLKPGEIGMVPIIAPTTKQARIVKSYLRAIFDLTPLLRGQIVKETQQGFELVNGVIIEILVGDWRSVRGYTLLACIVDEVCFFGLDAESKVRSDTELIRALKPALSTLDGWLICISSPYAKKGWAYKQWKRNQDNPDTCPTLVWNCSSRTMNPTLPQRIVDEAMAEDLQAAKSEYLGEFRDDICFFLPREVIESVVVKNRFELLPRKEITYFGFADVSGGRNDDAALAIAHKVDRKVVMDYVKRYKPPHSPQAVIKSMSEELKRYHLTTCTGDNYSAEFVVQSFKDNGIYYRKSELPKSGLYLELMPRICSREVELLDDDILVAQLASLERKTRSGGRDSVDHGQGGHDDTANVCAGVCAVAGKNNEMKYAAGWDNIGK